MNFKKDKPYLGAKIFATHITTKGLKSKTYNEFLQASRKMTNKPSWGGGECVEDINR